VEVESTIRPAKDRIAGFEGREGHRTPFASVVWGSLRLQSLRAVSNLLACGFIGGGDVGRATVFSGGHGSISVPTEIRDADESSA
jgi:hypothetical protein